MYSQVVGDSDGGIMVTRVGSIGRDAKITLELHPIDLAGCANILIYYTTTVIATSRFRKGAQT